jgi:hypothetical protein
VPANHPQVGACVLGSSLYESIPVKNNLHPMDMFRHEVANVIERWVHESDLDFIEMMYVMEELKMELVFQNLGLDDEQS